MQSRIGVMQGRLSPPRGGRIQSFPWESWQDEFAAAARLGLGAIEWTLDRERLDENPLMRCAGRREIRALARTHGVSVATLTGDCFMQAPFHKAQGPTRALLLYDFARIVDAAAAVGIDAIVLPIVDGGAIADEAERDNFLAGLHHLAPAVRAAGLRLLLECEDEPAGFAALLAALPADVAGVNYDIGNSAGRGHDPRAEFAAYGERIANVHVKDRPCRGSTVPLGEGDADFPAVFAELDRVGYRGRYILQAARAADGDHAGAVARYRDFVAGHLAASGQETAFSRDAAWISDSQARPPSSPAARTASAAPSPAP